MAKRRGGRFKKMMGLGFISFDKAFSCWGQKKSILCDYPPPSQWAESKTYNRNIFLVFCNFNF
jgi:hypothetical protein